MLTYTECEIRRKLRIATEIFLERDRHLLTVKANERSITHKLAIYLEPLFPDWDVDCEYNRDGKNSKRVDEIEQILRSTGCEPTYKDTGGKTVYPDIIVHHRGKKENLLVIEVKKNATPSSKRKDVKKLQVYLESDNLRYEFGVFLNVRTETQTFDKSEFISRQDR